MTYRIARNQRACHQQKRPSQRLDQDRTSGSRESSSPEPGRRDPYACDPSMSVSEVDHGSKQRRQQARQVVDAGQYLHGVRHDDGGLKRLVVYVW